MLLVLLGTTVEEHTEVSSAAMSQAKVPTVDAVKKSGISLKDFW